VENASKPMKGMLKKSEKKKRDYMLWDRRGEGIFALTRGRGKSQGLNQKWDKKGGGGEGGGGLSCI